MDERFRDAPRSIAALFADEAAARRALDALHDGGFTKAWLGVTRSVVEGSAFPEIDHEIGGGATERLVRFFSGNGGETLYAALTDHGIADDVARRLQREMPENGVVVIAGWTGDIEKAAALLAAAGGELARGDDGGTIGTSRERKPQ
jgi:hypothetical protein